MINLHEATKNGAEVRLKDLDSRTPFYHGLEYTPPARGTWTIAHTPMLIPGAHEIFVCPEGCLRGVVLSAAEFDGLDRFHMITVKESDLYTTKGMETLFIDGVSDILDSLEELPPCVVLFTSCLHHFLGTDTGMIFHTLREKYPSVDIIEASMNCTLRNSKKHYEEATNSALYAAVDPLPTNPNTVDIVGNYFALDTESELVTMLRSAGFTVKDLCRTETYEDYKSMGEAAYALYTHPMGKLAAADLETRIGITPIGAPYSWDYDEILTSLKAVSDATGAPLPNTDELIQSADLALAHLKDTVGDTELQIDGAATPRPLQMAKLLLDHGLHVTAVYADAVLPGDEAAMEALRVSAPDLRYRAITNFRCRTWPRDEAEGKTLIAIGQKAAYYTGTDHFVNLIYNNGLWGFTGIVQLCELIEEAYHQTSDVRKLIQIKAWGCHA